jgi:hypothetical protein
MFGFFDFVGKVFEQNVAFKQFDEGLFALKVFLDVRINDSLELNCFVANGRVFLKKQGTFSLDSIAFFFINCRQAVQAKLVRFKSFSYLNWIVR